MRGYDEWKLRTPPEYDYLGDDPADCTCPRELGAGGIRKTDKWCPLHGLNPDAEYEKKRDDG